MINCNLGLSCEPVRDSLESCEHLVHKSLDCKLCKLQKQITALTDMYKELSIIVAGYHDHKIRQIDENRKISKRVDGIDMFLRDTMEASNNINKLVIKVIGQISQIKTPPNKCPVCDGHGMRKNPLFTYKDQIIDVTCISCSGKGIV